MSTQNAELTEQNGNGRNPIIFVGGFVLLVAAFLFLIFGGTLFGNDDQSELQVAEVEPAQVAAVQLPESGPPLQVGDRPYEFVLQDLEGQNVALSQFIGRPILVNFWATWCGPCRIEMPEIEAVWQEYKDEGLVVLALDQDESAEDVQAFFDEFGLTFTPLLDEGNDTSLNFGVPGTLPASVFINAEGEVTAVHRGIMTRGQLDAFLAETLPANVLSS